MERDRAASAASEGATAHPSRSEGGYPRNLKNSEGPQRAGKRGEQIAHPLKVSPIWRHHHKQKAPDGKSRA